MATRRRSSNEQALSVTNGIVFLGAGVVIGYLLAVKRCPKAPLASERPLPVAEQETDGGKVVHAQFGGSERKERVG